MERKLINGCYISEEKVKKFFNYYTKLKYVSMKTGFSHPPSCHPSVTYNITVAWEDKEYNVYFEMVDEGKANPWFYSLKTDLEACGHFNGERQVNIGNQYFDYVGYLNERTIKLFMLGDEVKIDTIKQIEAQPQISKLKKTIKEIDDALIIINRYSGRDLYYEKEDYKKELKELEAIKWEFYLKGWFNGYIKSYEET